MALGGWKVNKFGWSLQELLSTLTTPTILTHNPHNPHTSHDPRIRPLADFIPTAAAAAAGCAPQHSVIAPQPEPEKAWLFGRRSRPLPVSVCPRPPSCADCGCCRLRADFPLDSSQPRRRAFPAGPELPTGLTFLHPPSLPFETASSPCRLVWSPVVVSSTTTPTLLLSRSCC
ncbi:hypothetical protein BDW02DRAFT_204046 [Decorospora gaudefroyi]|uniref:Uncharacterized protein n=1 Tax=Decorospora gaudefroyi TaxID=184978 RepID=A0A6A5JYN9_9PLEO|nr:hypothetical protein BDW02DRAFT_204046 [Decorospora gaudefroyi]